MSHYPAVAALGSSAKSENVRIEPATRADDGDIMPKSGNCLPDR